MPEKGATYLVGVDMCLSFHRPLHTDHQTQFTSTLLTGIVCRIHNAVANRLIVLLRVTDSAFVWPARPSTVLNNIVLPENTS